MKTSRIRRSRKYFYDFPAIKFERYRLEISAPSDIYGTYACQSDFYWPLLLDVAEFVRRVTRYTTDEFNEARITAGLEKWLMTNEAGNRGTQIMQSVYRLSSRVAILFYLYIPTFLTDTRYLYGCVGSVRNNESDSRPFDW